MQLLVLPRQGTQMNMTKITHLFRWIVWTAGNDNETLKQAAEEDARFSTFDICNMMQEHKKNGAAWTPPA